MKGGRDLFAIALAALSVGAHAEPKVGEEYEILSSYETKSETSDGSGSGSSRGRDGYLERVIAIRADGLELEYDLPKDTPADDRKRIWQFPARVFMPTTGPMQLLNAGELEARLEVWLKAAKWGREVCGRTIFTWNAFKIECDPKSVLETIADIDLRSADVREGAIHSEESAKAPAPMTRRQSGPDGMIFAAKLEIDPEAVRRGNAEQDVVVGEIMREPITLEAALAKRGNERYSGTIVVSFFTDPQGILIKKVQATTVKTVDADGVTETAKNARTLERKLISGSPK